MARKELDRMRVSNAKHRRKLEMQIEDLERRSKLPRDEKL